ncbi:MAG TPA: aminodeoxychorismate/anthranilate synthase component II [Candidatus Mediterraneibacter ornithocaccae]|jgi:anthranilate synthase component 2|uniref:anthranilate synthase component II n=1 Tax=Mediterraneibacter glycyrrhizinilyticus TaxID=342942 RepID=UPI001F8BC4CE|nr:aminodeoxychorismate/anthranilate synthase component II [Mediterraneibacter glycyrrhizinilyticus]MDN0044972.1 aminodeoxychorismate/anthranilate synthase component II [Mediterraneibacter glycyrrhizinilyticus]MDN0060207.1 aminodeoxychorismate/anthranilate synthase component II [Mediterraneibacter glycyrrhizinilyticus]HJA18339.1 aminodeoxychorismate/anthranilate synthase component II [Candidatus Mediterraneibacter ornithocaccae]
MILLIDNYDSFVYNLYQFISVEDPDVRLVRNDRITPEEVLDMKPDAIVISPGPGKPSDAGVCIELIRQLKGRIPILGVCLGHQAIGEAFGATVTHASRLMHGKTSLLTDVADDIIFKGIKKPVQVARYHSLSVQESTLPEELEVTARSDDGELMAMRHREYPIYGLQFHPESVMTPDGSAMIRNFLEAAGTAVNGSIDQKSDK